MHTLLHVFLPLAILAAFGCDDSEPYLARCVAVDLGCEPLYEPTFENIFFNTLAPRCALPGTGCHSAEGARDGLILDEPDIAYDTLMGIGDGRSRVIPGEPSCSMIVVRLGSISPTLGMPPRNPLPSGERCAIDLWIAAGAQR